MTMRDAGMTQDGGQPQGGAQLQADGQLQADSQPQGGTQLQADARPQGADAAQVDAPAQADGQPRTDAPAQADGQLQADAPAQGGVRPQADYAALVERNRAEARKQARSQAIVKAVLALVAVLAVAAFAVFAGVSGTFSPDDAGNSASQTSQANSASSASSQSASQATHTVVDTEGRTVAVPSDPQHVAVLDSFSGELAVMLGAGDRLYSVPGGTMSDKILQTIYPGLTGLVKASGSQVNVEDLVAARVDLAIVKGTLADTERLKLDNARIPYVVADYSTLDEQLAALDVVADALGDDARDRGAKLHAAFDDMIATVSAHTANIPEGERLRVYHSINGATLTDAAGSLGASWIALAGATSVSAGEAATSGQDYTATLEQVYAWAPDAIICSVASTAGEIRGDAQWQALGAVQAGKVYAIPIGATRWGQRGSVETPLAMLWLGCTLYPSAYADVDLQKTVTDYYRDCLGVDVDDALYAQILSGEGIRSSGNGSGAGS